MNRLPILLVACAAILAGACDSVPAEPDRISPHRLNSSRDLVPDDSGFLHFEDSASALAALVSVWESVNQPTLLTYANIYWATDPSDESYIEARQYFPNLLMGSMENNVEYTYQMNSAPVSKSISNTCGSVCIEGFQRVLTLKQPYDGVGFPLNCQYASTSGRVDATASFNAWIRFTFKVKIPELPIEKEITLVYNTPIRHAPPDKDWCPGIANQGRGGGVSSGGGGGGGGGGDLLPYDEDLFCDAEGPWTEDGMGPECEQPEECDEEYCQFVYGGNCYECMQWDVYIDYEFSHTWNGCVRIGSEDLCEDLYQSASREVPKRSDSVGATMESRTYAGAMQ